MSGQALRKSVPALLAGTILALGFVGVALAQHESSAGTVNVTLYDGHLQVAPTTFTPGTVTLVVVNKGKLTHALAIMGAKINARRTPTLKAGQSARLTVTLTASMYHVWDTVRGSMSQATMLMPRAAGASSSTKPKSSSSGVTVTPPPVGGSTGNNGGAGTMPMNPDDPCAGMM